MTDDELNEVKQLIDAKKLSLRRAAKIHGMSHATLYRRLLKLGMAKSAAAPEPEPQAAPEPESWEAHLDLSEIDWSEIHRIQREANHPRYHD